jgi:hypothetical protein
VSEGEDLGLSGARRVADHADLRVRRGLRSESSHPINRSDGTDSIFQGAADFDLELIESRTLDANIQELIYRPTLHV